MPPGKTRFTVQDNLTDLRRRKEEDLQRRAGELEAMLGRRPETELSGDYPATVLLEAAARETKPAVVTVGSGGLAGITRTRLGSVSTKVVTASRGPVLVPRTSSSAPRGLAPGPCPQALPSGPALY